MTKILSSAKVKENWLLEWSLECHKLGLLFKTLTNKPDIGRFSWNFPTNKPNKSFSQTQKRPEHSKKPAFLSFFQTNNDAVLLMLKCPQSLFRCALKKILSLPKGISRFWRQKSSIIFPQFFQPVFHHCCSWRPGFACFTLVLRTSAF